MREYKANRRKLNGYVTVDSTIRFNDRCVADDGDLAYDLKWSVLGIEKLYANDSVVEDWPLLFALNDHLESEYADKESIEVSVTEWMQPGFLYTFALNLVCTGYYSCDIMAYHEIVYDYATLKCTITGSDLDLVNVDPQLDNVDDVTFTLNGYSVTW